MFPFWCDYFCAPTGLLAAIISPLENEHDRTPQVIRDRCMRSEFQCLSPRTREGIPFTIKRKLMQNQSDSLKQSVLEDVYCISTRKTGMSLLSRNQPKRLRRLKPERYELSSCVFWDFYTVAASHHCSLLGGKLRELLISSFWRIFWRHTCARWWENIPVFVGALKDLSVVTHESSFWQVCWICRTGCCNVPVSLEFPFCAPKDGICFSRLENSTRTKRYRRSIWSARDSAEASGVNLTENWKLKQQFGSFDILTRCCVCNASPKVVFAFNS